MILTNFVIEPYFVINISSIFHYVGSTEGAAGAVTHIINFKNYFNAYRGYEKVMPLFFFNQKL
jgi:hypothetical protein